MYLVFILYMFHTLLILDGIQVGHLWSRRLPVVQGRASIVSHCELRSCLQLPAPPRLSGPLLAWIAARRCLTWLLLHLEEVELLVWDSLVCLAVCPRALRLGCRLDGHRRGILNSVSKTLSDFLNSIRCDVVVVLWKLYRNASRPIEWAWALHLFLGYLTSELLKYFILQLRSFTFIQSPLTFTSFKLLFS